MNGTSVPERRISVRLIDADALQRRICGAKCGCEYEDCGNEGDCGYDHFIFHAPTIDAVPVVRCQECKYSSYDEIFGNRWCNSHSGCRKVKDDDFCSYGERKEGADNG